MFYLNWIADTLGAYLPIILSSIALGITIKNELSKKFNIHVDFLDEKISEYLVDRDQNNHPDVYDQDSYRLIPMICITNNSSYPITITEFKLNNKHLFAFFTKVGSSYEITLKSATKVIGETILATSNEKTESLILSDLDKHLIKPPFTIGPYQSVSGFIFFAYNSSLLGDNLIQIKTSRGTKEANIAVNSQYISKKVPDHLNEIFK